jgi:hypothetical protein
MTRPPCTHENRYHLHAPPGATAVRIRCADCGEDYGYVTIATLFDVLPRPGRLLDGLRPGVDLHVGHAVLTSIIDAHAPARTPTPTAD